MLGSGHSLPADALSRAIRSRPAVVVGIPTRNEEATIATVVAVAMQGLRDAGLLHRSVIVNADNGSSDRTPEIFASAAKEMLHVCLSAPVEGTGKGSNVLAILDLFLQLDAQRLILLDADVRTIEPYWIERFFNIISSPEATLAVPVYRRNRFEGNTTNHIASPLMAAVFGVPVQQPIAGDFALNRAFVQRALSWPIPESAKLYGIDIHLTANAAREGIAIQQVQLGHKLHSPGFPKILFGSQQVIDSLFHVIARSRHLVKAVRTMREARQTTDAIASRPNPELVSRTVAKAGKYLEMNRAAILHLYPAATQLPGAAWGFRIDARAWAALLGDALEGLAAGHHAEVRDHLVALYLSRVITYWDEIEHLAADDVDAHLDMQTGHIVEEVARRQIRFSAPIAASEFHPGYWRESAP